MTERREFPPVATGGLWAPFKIHRSSFIVHRSSFIVPILLPPSQLLVDRLTS
jgi:hypothetical protein